MPRELINEKKKKVDGKKDKILVLLDGHAIIHRAFHALAELTNESGEQMGAVYGFTTMLLRILQDLKPDYLVATFDLAGPTFRHLAYERYKAQRVATPKELSDQFAKVKKLVKAFGIPVLENEGYEADDIIGTVSKKIREQYPHVQVIIVTGDYDTFQLIQKGVRVFTMRKGVTDTVMYDEASIRKKYQLQPSQMADFKGLVGDSSDNIPGVKGVGEIAATNLLRKYKSIERLYESLPKAKLTPGLRKKLEDGREEAFFSKTLATINTEVPISLSLADAVWDGTSGRPEVEKILREFGFISLLQRLGYLKAGEKAVQPSVDGGLFSVKTDEPLSELPSTEDFSGETRLGFFIETGVVIVATSRSLFQVSNPREPSFKKVFEAKRERVFFDQKALLKAVGSSEIQEGDFDMLIATYLLRPGERLYTPERAAREAGIPASGRGFYQKAFQIRDALEKRLKEKKLWEVFSEIDMPTVPILAELELLGMQIDAAFLKKLSISMKKKLAVLEKEIQRLAGREFNISSPRQVAEVLFDVLKLERNGIRKTEGGAISTDARELAKLKSLHPIVEKILEHREISKLLGTYIDALPQLVDRGSALHTTLNQTMASTGRLSSSDPNLQNIPVRTEEGREIRKAFVARRGYQMVAFDYSQIELRVAAAMSGETKMQEAFRQGKDIHAMTAMQVNDLDSLDKVTREMRYAAKALNFGILYGIGPRAFAESANIDYAEARRFMAEYQKDFPKIREFMQKTLESARKNGYVETMLGRRRYIPEINSPNWRVRGDAERMAMNAPIQGTATGDIVKLAMIAVHKYLQATSYKLEPAGHLLMQVHDELLCEIKVSELSKVSKEVKKIMEGIYDIGVPLVVDVKVGPNWGEMKPL